MTFLVAYVWHGLGTWYGFDYLEYGPHMALCKWCRKMIWRGVVLQSHTRTTAIVLCPGCANTEVSGELPAGAESLTAMRCLVDMLSSGGPL